MIVPDLGTGLVAQILAEREGRAAADVPGATNNSGTGR